MDMDRRWNKYKYVESSVMLVMRLPISYVSYVCSHGVPSARRLDSKRVEDIGAGQSVLFLNFLNIRLLTTNRR